MKRTIIFEETWKTQHRVIVDSLDDNYLEAILDDIEHTADVDESIYQLENAGIDIISIERDYDEDGDGCEIYDVYETPKDELE